MTDEVKAKGASGDTGEAETPGEGGGARKVRLVRKKKKRRVRLRRRSGAGETGAEATLPDERLILEEEFEADLDPEDPGEGVRKIVGSMVEAVLPSLVKRALTSRSGEVSEGDLRELIADLPLGEDDGVAGIAGGVRGEFYRILTKEVQRFLNTINVSGELQKILTSLTFEIRTEVRFKATDRGVKPSVKNKVRVKK